MKKIIWRLWNQGWENAPSICKKCSDSWAYYNPDWEIRELSKEDLIQRCKKLLQIAQKAKAAKDGKTSWKIFHLIWSVANAESAIQF